MRSIATDIANKAEPVLAKFNIVSILIAAINAVSIAVNPAITIKPFVRSPSSIPDTILMTTTSNSMAIAIPLRVDPILAPPANKFVAAIRPTIRAPIPATAKVAFFKSSSYISANFSTALAIISMAPPIPKIAMPTPVSLRASFGPHNPRMTDKAPISTIKPATECPARFKDSASS